MRVINVLPELNTNSLFLFNKLFLGCTHDISDLKHGYQFLKSHNYHVLVKLFRFFTRFGYFHMTFFLCLIFIGCFSDYNNSIMHSPFTKFPFFNICKDKL